ncbi:MAG: transketolase C-terminal domain-containing protein [Oscillospiraceae bacterium]|nr:transketolase C-terminal domain-containing protein [Oscillospiraceae bacterium]
MAEKKATREAYGEALAKLGELNDKVVVLDADLSGATKTSTFKKAFPKRHFNVGIAECNLLGISAGLSTMGYIPFCSTFAIFGTGRAYEVVRNSVAYPHFNVKLACTHAGITVGEDGGSHQSVEDIALMRVIPGMTVVVPADAKETEKAVMALAEMDGPAYLRLGRSGVPVLDDAPFEIGRANVLREGNDIALFACGCMVSAALEAAEALAAEGKNAAVINVHTIKPLDCETIKKYAAKCKNVVTLEEHSVIGGLGDAVGAVVLSMDDAVRFTKIGIDDLFGQSGKADALMEEYGLSNARVLEKIRKTL